MIKVRAHTCYLGKTGYAAHARSFFRQLSNHVDLRVRNYTWDSSPDYLNDTDRSIIDLITLTGGDGKESDYHISHSFPNEKWTSASNLEEAQAFVPDVDIVLMDSDHFYFYEEHTAPVKIAYTVWESTEIPDHFFNQLLKFDYLWVATQWHRDVIVKQGYPAYRVFVVNEGVNEEFCIDGPTKKLQEYTDGRFKFLFFGRWDYRKSVPEIINAFLKAFPNNESVDLILSADNPYAVDGINSTEERLVHYGYVDPRIKIKHFVSREDYVSYLKNGHVLVTCARSEGWNIPLIEAMAAGTPVIYSNYGGQLEFASGLGNPVKIQPELIPAALGAKLSFARDTPGLYAEPDFADLISVMRDCYENYGKKKDAAMLEREFIRQKFSWERVGQSGYEELLKVVPFDLPEAHQEVPIIVMTHANTPEKVALLQRCVLTLKRQGYFVIVSSHISVSEEIHQIADYVIVEKNNPVVYAEEFNKLSPIHPIMYMNYPDFHVAYAFNFNHGYAVLRLILNGLSIALQHSYEKIHFVNYDYIIDDASTLEERAKDLDAYDIVTYKWNEEKSINSGFFSAKTEKIFNCLKKTKTKYDYFRYPINPILEDFFYATFEEDGLNVKINDKNQISKRNYINCIEIPVFPHVRTQKGDAAYIYLCKEINGDAEYIAMSGTSEVNKAELRIDGVIYDIELADNFPMWFYPVTPEQLERGVTVYVPSYKQTFEFNSSTQRAGCTITNKNLIKKLPKKEPVFTIHYVDGPFVEVKNAEGRRFEINFIDQDCGCSIYKTTIGNNSWARCGRKYYTDWLIKITDIASVEVFEQEIDLEGQKVYVSLESSSLGDSLSWFPHIDEFGKKHKCSLVVSTFKNHLFESNYPHIQFVSPGERVENVHAKYEIGWFYSDHDRFDSFRHPRDFKSFSMQTTTTDILGLRASTLAPKIVIPEGRSPISKPYVCIAMHSTAQAKYWNNPTGWQELTDWFVSQGYKVVMLSSEENGYMGNLHPKGVMTINGKRTLENTMLYLKHAKMFVGVGSGLSWLSWSIGIPTVVISGFSSPTTEMLGKNVLRIFNPDSCNSCFNRIRLDAGDWNWCPDQKGTPRQFECSKSITGSMVIDKVKEFMTDFVNTDYEIEKIVQESYDLGMVQNHKEILGAAEFFAKLKVKNFIEIGTDQGGTFAIWSKLSDDGIRISVDLPHGPFGRADYDANKRDGYLQSLGSNVTTLWGDSHNPQMLKDVENILDGSVVDFLFIDGDHTYEGVRADFLMYRHLVKPGGWIGFHDIKDTEFHRNANCRVDQLWTELDGNKIEFVDWTSSYGGIGFIQVPEVL